MVGSLVAAFHRAKPVASIHLLSPSGCARLHRNYVGSAERGERNVSIEALERWLDALEMSWELFGREIDMQSKVSRLKPDRSSSRR